MVDFSKYHSTRRGTNDKLSLYDLEGNKESIGISLIAAFFKSDESKLEGLNPEQKEMIINISLFLKGEIKKSFYMVQGGGGTGKSFSIVRALSGIDTKHIIGAAPSHFAKNVLQDFLGEKYRVTTIAALLGKKVTYDNDGNEVLVKIPHVIPPIENYPIIIIDEGSMVDDVTFKELVSITRSGNKALIILGDYCQLPPVNQATDSLFFEDISSELTIPMRFQGPLAYVTGLLRTEIIKIRKGLVPSINILNIETNRVSFINELGSGYFFLNSMTTLLEAAIRRFKKGKGTGYVRLLAYRNKTIDKLNQHIRVGLYGNSPMQFEHGEMLINNGGYTVKSLNGKDKPLIMNGELFKVSSAVEVIGPYEIPCISLIFEEHSFDHPVYAVATSGEDKYNNTLKRLKGLASENSKLWKDVFGFKESFAYFNYSYATSIHKAQGSTIDHVFILEDDVFSVKMTTTKEKLQSMYVAVSRASFRAYIYNKNFKTDNSKIDREALKLDV